MRWLSALCLLLALVVLAGCSGPKLVMVKGKVIKDNQPYKPPAKSPFTIVFLPQDSKSGMTYPAVFSRENSTFELTGPDNRGIPEGKYRVSLQYMASPETQKLTDKYSPANTPLTAEVSEKSSDVELDLSK